MDSSIPETFDNDQDRKIFLETFQEVRVVRPRDFTDVLSNGETVGDFYRRTGRNQENAEIYDKWVDPTFVSMCVRIMKKNPQVDRLPNGLTPSDFSIDHVLGKFSIKKKKRKKKQPEKKPEPEDDEEEQEPGQVFGVNLDESPASELVFGLAGEQ